MTDDDRRGLLEGEQAGARYALGAPRLLLQGRAGLRQGHRAGSSLEFREHRGYQPGDDLRHIDWNAYARSDQLAVKLFHEEIDPHLDVVLDGSRSMALEGSGKARAALGLAALLAVAAENAGYARHVWVARDGCHPLLRGGGRPSTWDDIDFDYRGTPLESFGLRPPAWRSRGIRVLLSDLLWVGDPLVILGPMAQGATAVVVVQLLAAADAEPPLGGHVRLVDVERDEEQEVFVDAAARRLYREALARHQQNWHTAARQVGALLTTVVAEELLRGWQLEALVAAEVLQVV